MMLAYHLSRLRAKPIRYAAMDPAHEQAIRNYLAIASRAMQVPTLLQNRQFTHMMGDDARLGGELGSTMLEQHDPASLAALIDLMSDRGITPYSRHSNTGSLVLPLLQQLHQNIAGYGQGQAGAHPAVLRGYGELPYAAGTQFGDSLPEFLNQFRQGGTGRYNLLNLGHFLAQYGHPESRNADQLATMIRSGSPNPLHAVDLHDLTATMAQGLGQENVRGQRARERDHLLGRVNAAHQTTADILQNHTHPMLWHYGEHGEFPQ